MLLKRSLVLASLALAFASAYACKPKPEEEPVAKVNGQVITKKEFDTQLERNMARYRRQSAQLPPGIESRIKESVLRRMIDDLIIEQEAKKQNIAVTDEEVNAKFDEHKRRFRTEQAFDDYLKRSNNTVENMKDDLKRNLLRDRVVEKLSGTIDVAEDEIKKYYEENKARFTEKEQIQASRILIRVPFNATDADTKAAEKDAMKVDALAKKKDANFEELAKQYSKGPEAGRGGDLGWFARGRMPAEFDTAAFALKEGQVSDVVKTRLGYEIIKVVGKKPERERTYDEVKENIQNSLLARKRNEKRRDVMRQLKETAKVEKLANFEQPPAAPGATPPAVAGGEEVPPGMPQPPPVPGMAPPPMGQQPAAGEPAPGAAPTPAAPAPAPGAQQQPAAPQ